MLLSETSKRFDVAYLYILQLATILSMVKPWKTGSILRVFICVNIINENSFRAQYRLDELSSQLRINAQTRITALKNVRSRLSNCLTNHENVTNNLVDQQQSTNATEALSTNEFVDMDDDHIFGINEFIGRECENTSCLYLYLPQPPSDKTLFPRYTHVLGTLSHGLPPMMFIHDVSLVTCPRL